MNILIVKLSAIGDVIHTLPALNAIRDHYPNAHITWLVEEAAFDLVNGHKALDRVIVSKRKKWIKQLKTLDTLDSLVKIYKFIKELQDTKYDLIIDFQALLKSGILINIAKADIKAGFGRGMEHSEQSHIFLNKRVSPVDMEYHAIERSLMLINALGISCKDICYNIPISEYDRYFIKKLLATNGVPMFKKFICINPVAKWDTKLWDNRKFAKLADKLIYEHGVQIVFTGGKEDVIIVDEIISYMECKAVNFAGKTTLKGLAALYEQCEFLISTDTGPMHLGAALGKQVIALFGPTAPWRTGPFGNNHKIIRSDIKCSPCFKRECNLQQKCMKQISVKQVFKAACDIING